MVETASEDSLRNREIRGWEFVENSNGYNFPWPSNRSCADDETIGNSYSHILRIPKRHILVTQAYDDNGNLVFNMRAVYRRYGPLRRTIEYLLNLLEH